MYDVGSYIYIYGSPTISNSDNASKSGVEWSWGGLRASSLGTWSVQCTVAELQARFLGCTGTAWPCEAVISTCSMIIGTVGSRVDGATTCHLFPVTLRKVFGIRIPLGSRDSYFKAFGSKDHTK